MSYKLYNRRGSGGFAVEAALALAGEPFELISIDSQPSTPLPASFREINPWGQVPVLITEDGTMMTETAAILIYLAGEHSGPDVAPNTGTPEHARLLRWTVFLATNVYESTLRRIYPMRYTTDPAGGEGLRDAAFARNAQAFQVLEKELTNGPGGPFLLGGQMSVVDVYLAMLFAWHVDHHEFPLCQALTHRVAQHSVIAPLWQYNFDHRLAVSWGRE